MLSKQERKLMAGLHRGERGVRTLAKRYQVPAERVETLFAKFVAALLPPPPPPPPKAPREPSRPPRIRPGREFGLDGEWAEAPLTQLAANAVHLLGTPSPAEVVRRLDSGEHHAHLPIRTSKTAELFRAIARGEGPPFTGKPRRPPQSDPESPPDEVPAPTADKHTSDTKPPWTGCRVEMLSIAKTAKLYGVSARDLHLLLGADRTLEDALTEALARVKRHKKKKNQRQRYRFGEEYLTISEATKRFGVSRGTIRNRLKRGETLAQALDLERGHMHMPSNSSP